MVESEIHAERTTVRMTLPLLAGTLGFMISFVTGITIWGVTTQSKAEVALQTAQSTKVEYEGRLDAIMHQVQEVREAQIRMEAHLGMSASYKNGKRPAGN